MPVAMKEEDAPVQAHCEGMRMQHLEACGCSICARGMCWHRTERAEGREERKCTHGP